MIVMKFGGTSVANNEAITRAISIVKDKLPSRPVVVVSALSRVTDLLYKIADAAEHGDAALTADHISTLRARHLELVGGLLQDEALVQEASAKVNTMCDELLSFTDAVISLGELTARSKAKIISYGELLSSTVIAYAMNQRGIRTAWVDARNMIITEGDYMKGVPVMDEIVRKVPVEINGAYQDMDAVITQGFISSTVKGEPSVLGRGGSDYTASLIGMAIDAEAIEIWTDVDGVKTADPRRVPNTRSIDKISFEEAAELAHFGAKVLHPLTIEPAVTKNIPVYVLNSMNPGGSGTAILQNDLIEDGVKSISFKERITMLNIFSTKMINVSGFLGKVFEAFSHNNISVDLISTSEANISLTIDSTQDIAQVVRQLSEFSEVNVDNDKSQVSIIGKNVVNQRGLLRWAMSSFNNANIYMISQDASGANISFVVDREQLTDVLHELHKYLFEY